MSLALDVARANIGHKVIYQPAGQNLAAREVGVITSVTAHYVFVRYGADQHSKATPPEYLTLEAPPHAR